MPAAQSTDALSVISFFLTLASLIGSFFYIHLSDWFRDIISIETKWSINKYGDDPDQVSARRECEYEIKRVANRVTLVSSIVTTLFIVLIACLSVGLWVTSPEKSDAWGYVAIAGVSFLVIYLGMTGYLLISGYGKANRLQRAIEPKG